MRTSATSCFLCLCAAVLGLSAATGRGDEIAEQGRRVFDQHRLSVVTVELVVKSKLSITGMGGQTNESRQEVTGTVIDSSGLTVLSLAAIDPGEMMQNVMSQDQSRFKVETELNDVKILLEDGSEVPAEVVLRDKDRDLALVQPKARLTKSLQALDLSNSAKVNVLDQVIALNRLGTATGRAYAASVERIAAVVEHPALFYVPETSFTTTTLGAPAFTAEGKVVGLFVMRALKGQGGGRGASRPGSQNVAGIILPADSILQAVRQLPDSLKNKGADQK